MNHKQGRVINTLHAINTFLDANDPVSAPLKDSIARKNIDAAITALDAFGATQSGGAQAAKVETTNQCNLVLALRRYHMEAIEHAAKISLPDSPDLSQLTMPKSKPSVQVLLKAAAGMSEVGKKHEATLVAVGLPADFVAQLDSAAGALSASVVERNGQQNRRTTGTAGLTSAASQARRAIRLIDTQVRPIIDAAKDASLRAGWNSAKRVTAKPGLPRGAVTAAAAAAANAGTQAKAQPSNTQANVQVNTHDLAPTVAA